MRFLLFLVGFFGLTTQGFAQCAMCAATAENSLEEGSTAAAGLNNGILYLLVLPFLFATIFFIVYKRRQHFLKKYNEQRA